MRAGANIQAGFSAGWSARPEKSVPIAKSILEIRQALNVSLLPISLIVYYREVEELRGENKKKRGE